MNKIALTMAATALIAMPVLAQTTSPGGGATPGTTSPSTTSPGANGSTLGTPPATSTDTTGASPGATYPDSTTNSQDTQSSTGKHGKRAKRPHA